jgi:hypothetical protein
MMESSGAASTDDPQGSFPADVDRGQLAEALTLTDRWLRRLIRALNEAQDQDSEEFQTELRRAKRQLRANRELREGGKPEDAPGPAEEAPIQPWERS